MAEFKRSASSEEIEENVKPLDIWGTEEVRRFVERHFSTEIASKFEAEDIDGDSIIHLIRKSDDDELFPKLGLSTFGKLCKFRKIVDSLLPNHIKNSNANSNANSSRSSTPLSAQVSPKPSMSDIASYGKDIQLLYKAKRGRVQRAAVQQWPGNKFPNFRLAEEKTKLDELAYSLKDECSIPEINFGLDGIKKHIQSVFNERRRAQKREKIDYDLPDKRFCRTSDSQKASSKSPLPALPCDQENKKKRFGNEDSDEGHSDELYSNEEENDEAQQSGADTDILDDDSDHDQEVTAVNLSSKSAKVLLLSYAGLKTVDDLARDYLLSVLKELKGKVSLAKSLHFDGLCKAVAVKLVNNRRVRLKSKANLSNLRQSDIILCKKK